MKRLFYGFTIAALIAGGQSLRGQQGGNPFIDHSDTGETVHVLPTPAALHSPHATQPTDAPARQGLAVYPGSYGSGNLTNHGGHEIPSAGFYPIYWNATVANSPGSQGYGTLQSEIHDFVTSFADGADYSKTDPSADYSIIQQYGSRDTISPILWLAGEKVDQQPFQSTISDSKVQSYIASLFAKGVAANTRDIYAVYFPSGMKITLQGGTSCSAFCGYHGHFTYNGNDYKYAVFPYADCRACSLSGKAVADMLTIVSSHEIREAVTDPDLNAWYDASGYEADDKCAWHNLYQTTLGHFWVQPEYSNGGNSTYPGPGCVVPNR